MFSLAVPIPKTLEKFYILLPNNNHSMLYVSAASFPFQRHTEGKISFLGRSISLPTSKEVDGTWTCDYEENFALTGAMTISDLERQINETYIAKNSYIKVVLTDQFTGMIPQQMVRLNHAWLQSVEPLRLDWSKPTEVVKWRLTFKYSSLKRIF